MTFVDYEIDHWIDDSCLFQDLIKRYAKDLALKEETVTGALESLRIHALNKLAEKSKFQTTGIATVKVKVAAGQASYFVHYFTGHHFQLLLVFIFPV